ncbi:MAG: VOC family protein [Gammaproteobacteria bacterium]|nr:MAG: VOC family protein [Gammaproteobacteria bacterium]
MKYIDHVNLVVNDLEAVRNFFLKFGFLERDSSELQGEWISRIVGLENVHAKYSMLSLPEGQTNIELIKYFNPESPQKNSPDKANQLGIRHIAFIVDDIDEHIHKLSGMGIECFDEVQTYAKNGKRLVYFYGPEGVILELAQYPE